MSERRALYLIIADEIADLIERGDYPPGRRVTAALFAERFGVSVDTVYRATALLADRGLMLGLRGSGTYITSPIDEEP